MTAPEPEEGTPGQGTAGTEWEPMVTRRDICEKYGKSKNTVSAWMYRDGFPEPVGEMSSGSGRPAFLYRAAEVEAWVSMVTSPGYRPGPRRGPRRRSSQVARLRRALADALDILDALDLDT